MTSRGEPKLADFGISKVKYKLSEGSKTLIEFASKPFSPPADDSQSGYGRDVFGFGSVLLWTLAHKKVETYTDFDAALDSLDADPKLIDLIGRCVSLDEQDRPRNAVQLLAETGKRFRREGRSNGSGSAAYFYSRRVEPFQGSLKLQVLLTVTFPHTWKRVWAMALRFAFWS